VSLHSVRGQGSSFTLRLPVRMEPAVAAAWASAHAAWAASARAADGPADEAEGALAYLPATTPPPPGAREPAAGDADGDSGDSHTPGGFHTPHDCGGVADALAPGTPPAVAQPPSPHLRCLLADDHALNLKLVQRLLTQHGFAVETARDGEEALRKLVAAHAARAPPSIALLDMQMPRMSGSEAARAFRAWEAAHMPPDVPPLPMFCITANVLEEHRAECEDAGMDGFITKPLRADALTQLAERAAAQAAAQAAAECSEE
jgi:CheY-like chemotaxis protein